MGKDLKNMNLHSNVKSSYLDLFSIAAVHDGQFTKETFEFTDKLYENEQCFYFEKNEFCSPSIQIQKKKRANNTCRLFQRRH